MVITVMATVITSILSFKQTSSARAPFSLLIGLEAAEARTAWETGGREALEATLGRFTRVTGASGVVFTDSDGTNLLTGKPESELIDAARRRASFPYRQRNRLVFSRFSGDGRYCFFLIIAPARLLLSNLQPAHLLVVGIAVALCYALAYYLTSPLRSLQRAVEKFGHAEFEARAPESRRDELGDLARTFNRMAERIQTQVAAQRRLLLDISHELRSPLARLSVAVELARSGEPNDVGAVALPLDRIQREADRLNQLIGQMLEVARVESDPTQRKVEAVRLDELIGALVESCGIEAQARGCTLELESTGRVSVEGDSELLRRAIENVVRNAIRYAPKESRVEVTLDNGGGRARGKVRDYGPGVPEAALARLFDPFYRVETDRNRASGGVGLGLSIARRAVELHQGTLRASNALPGLLVEIELPA